MPSSTKFVPDNDTSDFVDGVDRHFYEKQLGAKSPFDTTYDFKLAAAVAKDKARHQMIRAVREADAKARNESFSGFGNDSLTGAMSVSRSIDGVEDAPDENIKL
jgi:hypothetical protein